MERLNCWMFMIKQVTTKSITITLVLAIIEELATSIYSFQGVWSSFGDISDFPDEMFSQILVIFYT